MLDNSHLSKSAKSIFKDMTYEARIRIYDFNCLKCPYHTIHVRRGNKITQMVDLSAAIDIATFDDKSNIVRGCSADGGFSLSEITTNTCSLWTDKTDYSNKEEVYGYHE